MTAPAERTVGRGPTWAGARSVALTLLLGTIGASVALWLLGPVLVDTGPATVGLSVGPAPTGHTVFDLAPLGAVDFNTHRAPVRFRVQVAEVDQSLVAAYVAGDKGAEVPDVLSTLPWSLARAALTFVGVAALGGAVVTGIGRRSWRYALAGAVAPFVVLGSCLGVAVLTFDADAIGEPHVTGALGLIPEAAGSATDFLDSRDAFSSSVGATTGDVSDLYVGLLGIPDAPDADDGTVRILHISDLHLNAAALEYASRLATTFRVDVVANTGDDADWGSDVESNILGGPVGLDVPYLWVRGNHDTMTTQDANAAEGAVVLDGTETTVDGLTFFGIGDPTFSPKLDKAVVKEGQTKFKQRWSAETMLPVYAALPTVPDVVMTHDPAMTDAIDPKPPLRLAGHTHRLEVSAGRNPDGSPWVLVVNGSTGGAGLRVLDKGAENPMSAVIVTVDRETKQPLFLDEFSYRPLTDQAFSAKRIDLRSMVDDEG